MAKTMENLEAAFAGESQANRKYLAFAQKADAEGYPQAAKLFRAAAHGETIHAHAHLRAMGGISSTADNLKEALGGETYEFESMYPPMIADADAEGDKTAARSFSYANEVEKVHARLYQEALDHMENLPSRDYHVCSVCGYIAVDDVPESCPVCKAKAKAFTQVD